MSLEAFVWASNLPMDACPNGPYRVLLVLANHAGPDGGGAFPAARTIAERLSCTRRTVNRHLEWLLDNALIRHGDQRLVDHVRADKRPRVFDLNMTTDGVTKASRPSVDNHSRSDRNVPNGVTAAVPHRTVTRRDNYYPAQPYEGGARSSELACPNSIRGHRFEPVDGVARCMHCSMTEAQATDYAEGRR